MPSCRARVRMPPGLEPKSGSVSPKQPIASPVAIRGSHSSFWASEPCFQIEYIASAALHRHDRAQPGVAGLELQAGQAVRRRAGAGAPVAGEVHAEQPHRPELLGQLAHRCRAGVVPPGDLRLELVLDEGADRVADGAVLLGDEGVGVEQLEGRERHVPIIPDRQEAPSRRSESPHSTVSKAPLNISARFRAGSCHLGGALRMIPDVSADPSSSSGSRRAPGSARPRRPG